MDTIDCISRLRHCPASRSGAAFPPKDWKIIAGKAYVTDGDGIPVREKDIRLSGPDAPEHDQMAKDSSGRWFSHGREVRSRLTE